jgi:excisionase family DNA binding protein
VTARLLTTREVAETLGVSPETVLRWIDTRGLPARRLTSRAIRFCEDEVEAWLDKHATGAAPREGESQPGGRAHTGGYAALRSAVRANPPLDAATTEKET